MGSFEWVNLLFYKYKAEVALHDAFENEQHKQGNDDQ
ncbi:MAG: Uncharacterised protein [Cryomorphaceae bacterium]|nr:MAG: Uncharacterised protein [Cryomorphaceae bacterium]